MSELFKSKVGWLLSGIYLLTALSCLLYLTLIDSSNVIVALIVIILIAPWFYLFIYLNMLLGIDFQHEVLGSKNVDYRNIVDNIDIALSILINTVILYLLGFFLTKVFNNLSSRKPKP
jgi:hypothetical protein